MMLAQAPGLGPFEEQFVRLVDAQDLGPMVVLGSVAIAFGVGALHALAPGHGKAIVGAYLAGTRGRPRDAVALGVVVAAMHTLSVLLLGLGLFSMLRRWDGPAITQQLGPALRLAAGILVTGVGIGLAVSAHRRRMGTAGHHHHSPESGVSPLSRRGLVVLGASGGLLPSPSAFLVLATALFTGRLAYGLVLVAAFSAGLATTLAAIGLAVVAGRRRLVERLDHPWARTVAAALPWVAAAVLVLSGLVLAAQGLLGVL